ncbi:hypothetical protein ACSNOK_17540 [Streptomyces sp. URMC 126]|uniref:hypothetical protein n=1 Tax=Streptomyces sp. URMC 126 TaxID=3423401 RepID=UPI003F1955AA
MPRGRHRHSTSLHRLLPSSLVAATSVACAAGAWTVGETVVIRGLAAGAAVAAVVGSVLMRRWDRSAGKRVAQLTAARARDEWKTDERLAELETDLEETRQARARLEAKLRGKRAELARLRTEHADLLRRYATAETERASALEGRRLLASERSALGASVDASGDGDEKAGVPKAARALESAMQARTLVRSRSEGQVGAREYRRAADALRDLARNGAVQREAEERASAAAAVSAPAAPAVPAAPAAPAVPAPAPAVPAAPAAAEPAAAVPVEAPAVRPEPAVARDGAPAVRSEAAVAVRDTRPAMPVRRPAPPVQRRTGGFDFFGTQHQAKQAAAAAQAAVEEQDLADVVGEEALAAGRGVDERVIDLTAHDETEQIDVVELRDAI